jgi:homoserine dehydrogenase
MTPPSELRPIALCLSGFGAVHQHFARILLDKADHLARAFGLLPRVVAVADRGGVIYRPDGLDLAALLAHKAAGNSVVTFAAVGAQAVGSLAALRPLIFDILLEATPANLTDGEPGLGFVREALELGRPVVLANKAPLVLDYAGLHELARRNGARLAFSATVCGGLPVLNVGRRDLVGAAIHKVEGIFNSTTNYILSQVQAGRSFDEALAEAQRRGIAESDPSLDLGGWDAANKLVIIANAVLGYPARLEDVEVTGVEGWRSLNRRPGAGRAGAHKLVARAERRPDGLYRLTVGPELLPAEHFLARVSEWQMGIVFYTDIYEELYLKIDERGPMATAAAMLRDLIEVAAFQSGTQVF